jgi:K+-transporting ATPase ATPase C chain
MFYELKYLGTKMKNMFIQSCKMLLMMTVITGIFYPLFITFIGQVAFPFQANGSLKVRDGKLIGSSLIGQNFSDSIYFHPRPSAINYNPMPSGASNLGLSSAALHQQVIKREKDFRAENYLADSIAVPSEIIFASGSGVDPHISKAAAFLQVPRIIKSRALNTLQSNLVYKLIDTLTENRQFGILGEEVVNVLELNIKLNELIK